MKLLVSIFIMFFSVVAVYALEFHTYQEALKLQKQNKKIIMIDVMRTGCHYCSDMKRKVFDNTEMSKWLENRFIAVEINLDQNKIPFDVEIHLTPTFLFVDEHQNLVEKIPGSWNIQDFRDLTKEIK